MLNAKRQESALTNQPRVEGALSPSRFKRLGLFGIWHCAFRIEHVH